MTDPDRMVDSGRMDTASEIGDAGERGLDRIVLE